MEAHDARYSAPALTNGAIPICTEGCALNVLLAVSGAGAGTLWADCRADYRGLAPMKPTFAEWYRAWLRDEA